MGTLERVRGGEMRVGVAVNEPWTRMDGGPSGVEVELMRDFAAELDAEPVFVRGTVPDMLVAARQGEVDVLIGGLTDASPGVREQKEAAMTVAYLKTRHLVGVPPGEEPFDDPSGREVAVARLDASAAHLKEQGAEPLLVGDLSAAKTPVVAYPWQLEAWGFEPTGVELPEERHVMAVPLGENGWLVALERFLVSHQDEAEELLRRETTR
jgi:polar amino acid transport system substrate-binding protein